MPILSLYNVDEFKLYLLVLARFSVVLFMIPIFGTKMLPNMVKAAFAMVLSLLLYSVVQVETSQFPDTVIETGLLIVFEVLIGLMMSTCIRLFLGAVQLSAQVIGFQMSFSMINVVDPMSGANVSIIEQIAYWICLLVFVLLNGHYILLMSVIESFKLVPPGGLVLQRELLDTLLAEGSNLFVLSIKIGAPIIAALLFTSVAFGLTGKFAPQMNIMIVAMPLKIIVGLVLFGLALETIKIVTKEYLVGLKKLLMALFFWAGGDKMAEDPSGGEKTEDASARKLSKAREQGQVAKSMEVSSVTVLLAGIIALYVFAPYLYKKSLSLLDDSLRFEGVPLLNDVEAIHLLFRYSELLFYMLLPILLAVMIAALVANIAQVGFQISWGALEFKLSKLNPISGMMQKFSMTSVVELLKSVLKLVVVFSVAFMVLRKEITNILLLYDHSVSFILLYVCKVSFSISIKVLLVMILLAVLDFAYQKWKFLEDQKMTKQETKEEHKQMEGDPKVKAKIRQIQTEAARQRMMAEVPEADVVVTNPTRLAVALKYDNQVMDAPMVVAKGSGAVAANIRRIAEEAGVSVVENKELARNLYTMVDVGQGIPEDLFQAVAELLAYVYNLKGKNG